MISCILLAASKDATLPICFMRTVVATLRKRGRSFIIAPALIGILSFAVSFIWIIPIFNRGGESLFLPGIAIALRDLDAATIPCCIVQSLNNWGWLSLASPISLLALPDLIINSFFSAPMPWLVELGGRYQLVIACGLFLGAVEGHPRIASFVKLRFRIEASDGVLIILLLTTTIVNLFRGGTQLHYVWDHLHRNWTADVMRMNVVSRTSDPLIANLTLCGYFANREVLWAANLHLREECCAWAVWYVGKKSRKLVDPALAHWDTVCAGGTNFVLNDPQQQAELSSTLAVL